MIDLSDVSNALVNTIAAALYPNGTGAPSAVTNAVRVMPGWPIPSQLEADLAKNIAIVSVFPSKMERNTTAYPQEWQTVSLNTPTLTVTVSGQAVTIGGSVSVPQNVMITVNNKPYIYGVQAADTLAAIASALAALISADLPATTSGATVTIAAAIQIKAAIGVQGVGARELKRQAKVFQICCWANSYSLRDSVASVVDTALAKTSRLPLLYGFSGHVTYKGGYQIDDAQKANIYRRDLMYEVDYPTVEIENETSILSVAENINRDAGTITGMTLVTRTVWSN